MINKERVDSYKKDIQKLKKMIAIYNETDNLCGAFYFDMMEELKNQIIHCDECLKNLRNYKNQI
jgi:hypothetical protein